MRDAVELLRSSCRAPLLMRADADVLPKVTPARQGVVVSLREQKQRSNGLGRKNRTGGSPGGLATELFATWNVE